MRSVYGLGLAAASLMVASAVIADERPAPRKYPPSRVPAFRPNDHGPVIDTTRESKRARRRRLAREAQGGE